MFGLFPVLETFNCLNCQSPWIIRCCRWILARASLACGSRRRHSNWHISWSLGRLWMWSGSKEGRNRGMFLAKVSGGKATVFMCPSMADCICGMRDAMSGMWVSWISHQLWIRRSKLVHFSWRLASCLLVLKPFDCVASWWRTYVKAVIYFGNMYQIKHTGCPLTWTPTSRKPPGWPCAVEDCQGQPGQHLPEVFTLSH